MYRFLLVISLMFPAALAAEGPCGDWITARSYYTHDQAGNRVQQYLPIGPFYIYPDPHYQRSGYHHTRSSLQVGSSVDHFHQVEEWGRPVRPYDEWRFPYRPYSVPFDLWGPPFAGLGFGFGAPLFPYGGFPYGGFPGGFPGSPSTPGFDQGGPRPTVPVPYPGFRPWLDDRYPAFDDRAPFRQQPFPVPAP